MKIELSQFEVELLDSALVAWEKEPHLNGMMGGVMGAIFTRGENRDEARAELNRDMAEASGESKKRRLQAALLRAKLLQGLAAQSEHTVETETVTPPQSVPNK